MTKCLMFVNKATINIKYFNCCITQICRLSFHNVNHTSNTYEEKQERKQLLQKYLDLSYNRSAALIRNNPYLQNLDNFKLENTLDALDKMGINKEDIVKHPMTLTLHYNTIEHNFMYLKEAGFNNLSAKYLLNFRTIVKKPIALLKAHGVISEDVNVPNRLFSYLNPKPLQFPLLDKFNKEDSIVHMHEEIFKHYLVWRLDASEQEINRIFKNYDKFKYRSFKLMSDMIRLLTKELKFSKEKILQQSYLFQVNPQYLTQHLNLFPIIAGVDIKCILYRFPKIIAVPPESIANIISIFKSFNVPDESLSNCFEIFTLCPNTILYRLKQVQQIPEFDALKKNKRFVRLLYNYNKAKLRLDHLHKLKMKNTSINLLVASETIFEKFTLEGYETNRGVDVLNYLSGVFNLSSVELRKLLSHNPHWCQVPLIHIQDSLKYLINTKLNFPIEEIKKLPVILLYSRNVIAEALLQIENHPELYNLVLNSREKLSLCLYFIEKKYHFSGDGVWEDKTLDIKSRTKDEAGEDLVIEQPETTEEIKKRNLG